jgi:hypothetical protein
MGKGKLAKFADMAEYPHVFEYPYSVVDDVPFEMKGNWNRDFFKNDHPIVLELGCGRGEYTVGLARRYPEKNFIGVDIKGARMWTGATDALKEGLTNAAFLRTNIEIIDRFFAPGEVSEIWLTFSDPQMKKATKRLTSTYFMNRYRRFLVPPANLSIDIRIHTTTGQCYDNRLETYSFSSGHEYSCAIKLTGEEIGISTVEDFIAFTHLINGEAYGERSLEEFGEKMGENMTYYLLNDLTFTEEESAQVQMIGKYGTATSSEKRLFEDVFDGKGHSLSNLHFTQTVEGNHYAGLFSGISENGAVKNLILDQAVYSKDKDTKKTAFLIGLNRGEVNHCILRNCSIENINPSLDFGGLSYQNEGIIINCHTDKIYLHSELQCGSSITRNNQNGKIMNCVVSNCNLRKAQAISGFICNIVQSGEIQNCYLKGNEGDKNHAICLKATDAKIRCCYYPKSDTKAPIGYVYDSTPDSIMKYNSIDEEKGILPTILNQWVLDSGKRLFPHLTFCLWEKGETLPAILVSP